MEEDPVARLSGIIEQTKREYYEIKDLTEKAAEHTTAIIDIINRAPGKKRAILLGAVINTIVQQANLPIYERLGLLVSLILDLHAMAYPLVIALAKLTMDSIEEDRKQR